MRSLFALFLLTAGYCTGQSWNPPYYVIANVAWQDIWIDPVNGSDLRSGASLTSAVRSVNAAWNRIPAGVTLSNAGYRLRLMPGTHTNVPNYWESKYGTVLAPILLEAAATNAPVILPDLNIYDCSHLYFTGLVFNKTISGGDGFHIERGRHVLLRNCVISGNGLAHEGIKVNQSQHIYLERCDISGAEDNAVDFVAVQYGHVASCRIHGAGDWAMYVKGGSAYIRLEANEVFNAGTGGITAGQGTGFEFMEYPWLHYEAYDIKIVNNYIHDTTGAGLGVNGGYNILMAYNTLVRVGANSHVIEIVHGRRGCDGYIAGCFSNQQAGGWGNSGAEEQFIPNRNVYVFNNIIYNPAPYQSQWQHFSIHGPVIPPVGANVPSPSRADDQLIIRGNVIWNGPVNHPVLGDSGGCQSGTCTQTKLVSENHINSLRPQFSNEAAGDFRPAITGNLFAARTYDTPGFPGGDKPVVPVVPDGLLDNTVPRERNGYPRHGLSRPPGAWTGGASIQLGLLAADNLIIDGEVGYRYRLDSAKHSDSTWSTGQVVAVSNGSQVVAWPTSTGDTMVVRAVLVP